MTSVRKMDKILKEAEDRLDITRDKRADIDSFARLMKVQFEEVMLHDVTATFVVVDQTV